MTVPLVNKSGMGYTGVPVKRLSQSGKADFAGMLASESAAMSRKRQAVEGTEKICLGVISKSLPTVSHLLVADPDLRRDCWRIVHSPVNRGKPYTRIPENTAIYMNPVTCEISWKDATQMASFRQNALSLHVQTGSGASSPGDYASQQDALFHQQLVAAVRAYQGMPYDVLDCYELVVQGLKDMGIQYHGAGGLKDVLMGRARAEGAPINRYLSGEGLIQAVGRHAYGQSFADIEKPDEILENIQNHIMPHLQEGAVLSFSTPSRGHTGIVGRLSDKWMFVNSGRLDHDRRHGIRDGVGEEALTAEIENWVHRAARHNEPLTVTLGMIDMNKLMPFWEGTGMG